MGDLAENAAGNRSDRGGREERRREEPDDETDASPDLSPLAAQVVAGLFTATSPFASFVTRTTPSVEIAPSCASFT